MRMIIHKLFSFSAWQPVRVSRYLHGNRRELPPDEGIPPMLTSKLSPLFKEPAVTRDENLRELIATLHRTMDKIEKFVPEPEPELKPKRKPTPGEIWAGVERAERATKAQVCCVMSCPAGQDGKWNDRDCLRCRRVQAIAFDIGRASAAEPAMTVEEWFKQRSPGKHYCYDMKTIDSCFINSGGGQCKECEGIAKAAVARFIKLNPGKIIGGSDGK